MSETRANIPMETQQQRWMKYGANVVLVCLLAVLLWFGLIYFGERYHKRFDATSFQLYSLRPQTLNIIRDNPQRITITSFYTKAKPLQNQAGERVAPSSVNEAQVVADLLQEYKDKGTHIDVQVIDPNDSPAQVDDLISEVSSRYGGAVDKYKKYLTDLPARYDSITQAAAPDIEALHQIEPVARSTNNEELLRTVVLAERTVDDLPRALKKSLEGIDDILKKQRVPPYKDLVTGVQKELTFVSQWLDALLAEFEHYKDENNVPTSVRDYMKTAIPRYQELRTRVVAINEEANHLGDLKLDRLRKALTQRDSILIRGENDWEIITHDEVWDQDIAITSDESFPPRPRFGGEQMITSAILSINHPQKRKVVFVRNGGPPLAKVQYPLTSESGFFSAMAQRLRTFNYDVLDKDLTGAWAAQTRGLGGPDPSDADIHDAVWIVLADANQQRSLEGMPPPTIAARVMEHLNAGGSALFMLVPRGEDMSLALHGTGIYANQAMLCVHPAISNSGLDTNDPVQMTLRSPAGFEITRWGDAPMTPTLGSLAGVISGTCPISVKAMEGVTNGTLIPIPDAPEAPRSWAAALNQKRDDPGLAFEPSKGDRPGPLFGGAWAEKGKTRVAVFGTPNLFANPFVLLIDDALHKQHIIAPRFPGNAELFMNSIFWLSRQDQMIAISPAAMQVSRIASMSLATQRIWHVGVLIFVLPGLVLLAGALVYYKRNHSR